LASAEVEMILGPTELIWVVRAHPAVHYPLARELGPPTSGKGPQRFTKPRPAVAVIGLGPQAGSTSASTTFVPGSSPSNVPSKGYSVFANWAGSFG